MNNSKGISFGLKSRGKASKASAAFGPGSDDEEEQEGQHDQKRQKRFSEGSSMGSASFVGEPSEEEKKTAEKLAQFVAKNGRQFEDITRQRNPQGGIFKFLFDKESSGYRYYARKVEEYSKPPGALANPPLPPVPSAYQSNGPPLPSQPPASSNAQPPLPGRSFQAMSSQAQPSQFPVHSQPAVGQAFPPQTNSSYSMPPPANNIQRAQLPAPAVQLNVPSTNAQAPLQTPVGGQTERKRRSRWQESAPLETPAAAQTPRLGGASSAAAQTKDDSVAAMERFAAQAAAREQERLDKEAAVPLLNETSFDRRRTMAVYKEDGTRGHHMQDFIPKEELAKLLAKSGTEDGKAQAEAIEAASRIQSDNIGHKLLSQMGWKEGEGLGASGAGVAAPVTANTDFGGDKRGLGAESHTAVQEGDDEFEVYRKRMMLGYKHRPNPLGNPRKNYY